MIQVLKRLIRSLCIKSRFFFSAEKKSYFDKEFSFYNLNKWALYNKVLTQYYWGKCFFIHLFLYQISSLPYFGNFSTIYFHSDLFHHFPLWRWSILFFPTISSWYYDTMFRKTTRWNAIIIEWWSFSRFFSNLPSSCFREKENSHHSMLY